MESMGEACRDLLVALHRGVLLPDPGALFRQNTGAALADGGDRRDWHIAGDMALRGERQPRGVWALLCAKPLRGRAGRHDPVRGRWALLLPWRGAPLLDP